MAFANFSISDNHRSGVMQPLILILSLVVVWLSSVAAPVNSDPAQVSLTNPLAHGSVAGNLSNPAQARPPALGEEGVSEEYIWLFKAFVLAQVPLPLPALLKALAEDNPPH